MFPIIDSVKNLLFLGLAALSIGLGACSKSGSGDWPEGTITRNDFENVQGWGGANEGSLTTERAHSGRYSISVNPQTEFSYTYARQLGQMAGSKPKRLVVTAWAWVPDKDAKASLILEIKHSPEKATPVLYEGLELSSTVRSFKSWEQVSKTYVLPDSVASTNQVKLYVWRGSSPRPVYLDDVSIKVEN